MKHQQRSTIEGRDQGHSPSAVTFRLHACRTSSPFRETSLQKPLSSSSKLASVPSLLAIPTSPVVSANFAAQIYAFISLSNPLVVISRP